MTIELLKFVYRITEGYRLKMLGTSVISGASRGMILATINTTAASTYTDELIILYAVQFLSFLVIYLVSSYYVRVNSSRLVEKARQKMTIRMSKIMLLSELSFIEGFSRSELYQRFRMDVNAVCGVADTILSSSQAAILLVFCLGYIAWLVPAALFVTLLTIILGVVIYSVQNRKIKETIRKARTAQVQYGEKLRDMINGFKELKVNFVKRENFHEDLGSISGNLRNLNIDVTKLQTTTYLTTQIFMFSLIAVVIFVLPQYSQLDQTVMFQFFAAILFLIGPLETLVNSYQKITRANISYEQVTDFEDAINKHASEVAGNEYKSGTMEFNEIHLEDVCFKYQSNKSDDQFFTGPINLTVKRGEVLFIIGGNGTGKTTLLKLIAGLYTPTSGKIYIDGTELVLEKQQAYRELFTTIFTDFHIFSKVYGYDEMETDKFSQLMRDLNLEGKTSIVNGELTTRELSRGQKKRLAYLISLIDNRDIYVFDEFAADQDPNFKRYFYYTILPELKALGKTVIAVTHDDNYFDACDRLIKMDNGRLVDVDIRSTVNQHQRIVND